MCDREEAFLQLLRETLAPQPFLRQFLRLPMQKMMMTRVRERESFVCGQTVPLPLSFFTRPLRQEVWPLELLQKSSSKSSDTVST